MKKQVDLTGYETVRQFYEIATGNVVELLRKSRQKLSENGKVNAVDEYLIHRYAKRGKVDNYVSNYEYIDNQDVSHLKPIDSEYGQKIMDRIERNVNYSNVFIFFEEETSLSLILTELIFFSTPSLFKPKAKFIRSMYVSLFLYS